eukprot:2061066-Pleurochrysis_carterae.AAC.2
MTSGPTHVIKLQLNPTGGWEGVDCIKCTQFLKGCSGAKNRARHAPDAPRCCVVVAAADRELATGRQDVVQGAAMSRDGTKTLNMRRGRKTPRVRFKSLLPAGSYTADEDNTVPRSVVNLPLR